MARTPAPSDDGESHLRSAMTESQRGPDLRPRTKTYTRGQLNDQISNENAGRWRGMTESSDY